jgi:adenine-specific DNA-methyltransferase
MQKEEMKNAGYNILEGNPNSLEAFLKTHYPQVFRDGEFDLNELKNLLNIHTETRGYGLNFVGKSFALQKYSQETKMELKINQKLSKNFGETQNAVIRGDNLDTLKILKNNYAGQVKCIYIDPPYNTKSDEFIYSDSFRTHENALLEGYTESEIERMEGIFKTKQSHSGWLSFMLPRLKLARDLLREDGVIFVSIDDNEQANLKLLMDEVFGEECCEQYIWSLQDFEESSFTKTASNTVRKEHEYVVVGFKDKVSLDRYEEYRFKDREDFSNSDNDPRGGWMSGNISRNGIASTTGSKYFTITTPTGMEYTRNWTISKEEYIELLNDNRIYFANNGDGVPRIKIFKNESSQSIQSSIFQGLKTSITGKNEIKELFNDRVCFDFPKPTPLIKRILQISTTEGDIILDFFAGSGTTGQAVMELNHENPEKAARQFILVQLNEEIKEGKEAHKFCVENGLEPVISSITIERLRRAGAKYKGDAGFKVFDCIKKTELVEQDGQLSIEYNKNDDLSRVYNLVVKSGVGLNAEIKAVVEGFIYKAEDGFYVINAKSFDTDAHKNEVKKMFETGQNIYIDGWTASINMTLQQYKSNEKMKIVY